MAKKYVQCIKIVHHPAEVRKYRVLSAFFRFIGVFACENLIDDEYGDEVDYIYRIKEGSEEDDTSIVQWIFDALDEIKDFFDNTTYEELKDIAVIFSQNDLMRGSYAIGYFGDTGNVFIYRRMLSAMGAFEKALEELEKLEQRQEHALEKLYIWMAKSNCRRRINELYTIIWSAVGNKKYNIGDEEREELKKALKSSHYFRLDEVRVDIAKALDEESLFYSAYAIWGFLSEIDDDYRHAGDAFEQAVRFIGNKSYASYLLFRMGRHYNNIYPNLKDKMKFYRSAYEVDRHNFRAGYQLAVNEQDCKNYSKAFEIWNCLLEVLESKRGLPSLQPVECAYLYKIYRNIGNLHSKQREYAEAIQYLMKAESVYESQMNEDLRKGFYPWIFGREKVSEYGYGDVESWEIYKREARKKLEIKKTYRDIVNASGRGNLEKIYDKYIVLI